MSSLRWVLLGLGALLIGAIYLWGRGVLRRPRGKIVEAPARIEPTVGEEPAVDSPPDIPERALEEPSTETAALDENAEPSYRGPEAPAGELESEPDVDAAADPASPAPETEHVITVRLVSKGEPLNGQTVVLALRAAGLQHGRYGIFHRLPEAGVGEPLFSVANLTEPGTFDLTNLAETTLPGMSFFLLLPGVGDPVERFDMMVDTARSLALELDAELHDDRGSTWSIQRERYVREQIIEYRYQLEKDRAGSRV